MTPEQIHELEVAYWRASQALVRRILEDRDRRRSLDLAYEAARQALAEAKGEVA